MRGMVGEPTESVPERGHGLTGLRAAQLDVSVLQTPVGRVQRGDRFGQADAGVEEVRQLLEQARDFGAREEARARLERDQLRS